jgi:hypothetical protein
MLAVQNLCCSSTSSTFLVAKSYLTSIPNLPKGPATVFDFTADRHAIHGSAQDLGIQLPAQWLWDILDEFVYHYQSGTPDFFGNRSSDLPSQPSQVVHGSWFMLVFSWQ